MSRGVPVVTAPAEIDITSADQLRVVLLDAAARGHATVVVDLTRTRFCDCCGLHTLLRAHNLAQADGGELRLVTPAGGLVPRLLALTCLDRLIPCFTSLKDAMPRYPLPRTGVAARSANCLRGREWTRRRSGRRRAFEGPGSPERARVMPERGADSPESGLVPRWLQTGAAWSWRLLVLTAAICLASGRVSFPA